MVWIPGAAEHDEWWSLCADCHDYNCVVFRYLGHREFNVLLRGARGGSVVQPFRKFQPGAGASRATDGDIDVQPYGSGRHGWVRPDRLHCWRNRSTRWRIAAMESDGRVVGE